MPALLLGKTIKSWKPETKPLKSIPGVRKCENAKEFFKYFQKKKLDSFIFPYNVHWNFLFITCFRILSKSHVGLKMCRSYCKLFQTFRNIMIGFFLSKSPTSTLFTIFFQNHPLLSFAINPSSRPLPQVFCYVNTRQAMATKHGRQYFSLTFYLKPHLKIPIFYSCFDGNVYSIRILIKVPI